MELGNLLKDLRLERGFTQQYVADTIGISRSVLSQYENNQVDPTSFVIAKFAKFFEVSADYLLGLEDDFGAKVAPIGATLAGYSAEEKQLIEDFRKLSPYMKGIALTTVHGMTGAKPDDLHKKA